MSTATGSFPLDHKHQESTALVCFVFASVLHKLPRKSSKAGSICNCTLDDQGWAVALDHDFEFKAPFTLEKAFCLLIIYLGFPHLTQGSIAHNHGSLILKKTIQPIPPLPTDFFSLWFSILAPLIVVASIFGYSFILMIEGKRDSGNQHHKELGYSSDTSAWDLRQVTFL